MITIDGAKAYTTKEAGEILGLTPYTIRKYIKDGRIEAKTVNGRLCVIADSLKQYTDISKKEGE